MKNLKTKIVILSFAFFSLNSEATVVWKGTTLAVMQINNADGTKTTRVRCGKTDVVCAIFDGGCINIPSWGLDYCSVSNVKVNGEDFDPNNNYPEYDNTIEFDSE